MLQRALQALPALDQIANVLGVAFSSETRLFELSGTGAISSLLVESWVAVEALSDCFEYHIHGVSTNAHLPLDQLLGQRATLHIGLADGSRTTRSGIVMQAGALQSDGGLARYQLVVRPWLAALQLNLRSQSFIDKSVVEIVEAVFQAHSGIAAWVWSSEVASYLSQVPPRHYCNQFAETDLEFVSRVLAEEGIGWCYEEDQAAPHGHRVRFFADSPRFSEDLTSAADGGIRFHRASSQEQRDAVQSFAQWHQLAPASVTLHAWQYAGKSGQSSNLATTDGIGGEQAPHLESYETSAAVDHHNGVTRFAAEHYARRQIESHEARRRRCVGASTVRSLRPGTCFTLLGAPLPKEEEPRFAVTAVRHAGINNLPRELNDRLAERLGAPELSSGALVLPQAVLEQARASGYANEFECLPLSRPWRPVLFDDTGARRNPKPTVDGPQSALVVGPDGQAHPNGADEIYMDRLGRIKVQFHWQSLTQHPGSSDHSIWVRVLQRYAGAGMGAQFVPRIGQEVVIDFEESDIDRPFVLTAVYNGKGEGGVPATPGGAGADSDTSVFTQSNDHQPGGQGNLSGGNSPPWHGAASAEGHQRNAAALSGVKTKEFGGAGYNQLAFDDSDQQLRVQAGNTQHATWLNLGHLLHMADNHRGSFRGTGFELRTDAYGAVRGGRGVLLSTYGAQAATPAGDNGPGTALAKQAQQLAQVFSDAAKTHQTVQQASHIGVVRANTSTVDPQAAPLKALHKVLGGMVAQEGYDQAMSDADAKQTRAAQDKLPHTTDPLIAVVAKAGLGIVAGQDLQAAAGEGIHLASGQDSHFAVGGQARLHTGQAIGVLAGAVKAGDSAAGTGLTLIAAQGDTEMQAQADRMQVAAKQQIDIKSKSAHIDWAAAKKITLTTAGGASITIDGGGIVTQCPGKITVHAGKKSFAGPGRETAAMPHLPRGEVGNTDLEFRHITELGEGLAGLPFKAILSDGSVRTGQLDAEGYARISGVPPGTMAKVEYDRDRRTPKSQVAAKPDADWNDFLNIAVTAAPVALKPSDRDDTA
ncbi:type VI secretion system tip protein VgrG [Aquabacterium sp. A7-Y]|uniref:type VI secretion system Vgr family protein n=1 Tax=Aquabacterium sp. A7-Y TaxID=1349605 RepID=UPI00223E0031|nr:type VI secretion system Vgr family protein [Aquabacterium sp. A7-Y]MCW7536723.1 type VI secretion system tip protein VgrG [Aquabacterium sp. A7-Y]